MGSEPRWFELERAVALTSPAPSERARRIFTRDLCVRYVQRAGGGGVGAWVPAELHDMPAGQRPAHSPCLAALREGGTCHLNGRPSLTLPSHEDVAIHVAMHANGATI